MICALVHKTGFTSTARCTSQMLKIIAALTLLAFISGCSTPQLPKSAPEPTLPKLATRQSPTVALHQSEKTDQSLPSQAHTPTPASISQGTDVPTIQLAKPPSLDELFPFPELTCAPTAKDRRSVRARHIVIEPVNWEARQRPTVNDWNVANRKATAVLAALASGEDFAKLEVAYSSAASARGLPGGDLGYFVRGVMVPQVERVAFCLQVNKLSPVVRSDFGFHIIQVTGSR